MKPEILVKSASQLFLTRRIHTNGTLAECRGSRSNVFYWMSSCLLHDLALKKLGNIKCKQTPLWSHTPQTYLEIPNNLQKYFRETTLHSKQHHALDTVSRLLQNSQENTFAGVSFLIKLQVCSIKKIPHRCFPVSFTKYFRSLFLQNTSVLIL